MVSENGVTGWFDEVQGHKECVSVNQPLKLLTAFKGVCVNFDFPHLDA